MTTPGILLQDGFKYALLSLPRLHTVRRGAALMVAEEGFALSADHPISDLEAWRAMFGRREYRDLAEAGAYLITYARAANPGILDDENRSLGKSVLRFHLGLLIACPFIAHDASVFVSGERRNQFTDIREHTTYPQITRLDGGPASYLTDVQLAYALALGRATQLVQQHRAGPRFGRVLTAFRSGMQERSLDTRIHQFVRCIEAFVGSWRKEEFGERVSELITGVPPTTLTQLYEIRSAVEHFGGWQRAVPVKGEPAKELVLLERSLQVQQMAHSVIGRFLDRPELWDHFINQATVDGYLRSTTASDRRALWSPPLDVAATTAGLDLVAMRAAAGRAL